MLNVHVQRILGSNLERGGGGRKGYLHVYTGERERGGGIIITMYTQVRGRGEEGL